jgi:hypothetical protein
MIAELDRVALTSDLPEARLGSGAVGAVVHVYEDGRAYEVEFVTFSGESIGIFTVEAKDLRELQQEELPYAGARR